MFLCSGCHRAARVLYARNTDRIWFFSCRKCSGITYQSTMGHQWDRSARTVEKLRARLQWAAGDTVTDQTQRDARKDLPAHFGDACLPRSCTKAGRELRSKI
jgi:hypothetical protein